MRYFLLLILSIVSSFSVAKTKTEVTPFASYRFGGDFEYGDVNPITLDLEESAGFGLIFSWPYDNKRQGEILLSHYSSEVTAPNDEVISSDLGITYLHLGGNIPLSHGVVPFWLSAGAGLTHFSPDENAYDDETKFSANIALTSKIPISENIKFRFDARVYGTFFDTDSAVFCDEENCRIFVESNVWVQSEITAGIAISF